MGDHEYHEITDEAIGKRPGSSLETFDLGPSLMDEILNELDILKPVLLPDDPNGQSKTENEANLVGKNEAKETSNSKMASVRPTIKNMVTVKTISPAEEQHLDSAIAMAKELANLSMKDCERRNENHYSSENGSSSSPKTPTSPNKKKFSFKLKNNSKVDREHFTEKTENIPGLQSTITEEAKVAYNSLIDKVPPHHVELGKSVDRPVDHFDSIPINTSNNPGEPEKVNLNPPRDGFSAIPKIKGNKQRIAATPQTASLARLTAKVNRSSLGAPPPPPSSAAAPTIIPSTPISSIPFIPKEEIISIRPRQHPNAPPVPPRDKSTRLQSVQLNKHQRKHPLIIPGSSLTSYQVGPTSGCEFDGSQSISTVSTEPNPVSSSSSTTTTAHNDAE